MSDLNIAPPEPPEEPEAQDQIPVSVHDEDDPEDFAGEFIPDPWER